jgi:farnesyl diphosphate synthase
MRRLGGVSWTVLRGRFAAPQDEAVGQPKSKTPKPMLSAGTFAERLARAAGEVERELETLLSLSPKRGELARPERLMVAMRYAALGGGKRLRPFLTIETARAFGRDDCGPRRVGAAIECVHAYSLIHDDLPAMDDDDLRRGRPTTHRAFDEATAILAGDALLTLAFEIVADLETDASGETRADLCLGLSRASGLAGMVGGQMLDIAAESAAAPLDLEAIARLQAMKTGALLRFSVEAGARLARAPAQAFDAIDRFGRALGSAFQIADDLLDAESDAATMGKRTGKDASRNKATFVAALGRDEARRRLDSLVKEAIAAIDETGLGEAGDGLRAAAIFVAARKT